jgi:hypothetical protein
MTIIKLDEQSEYWIEHDVELNGERRDVYARIASGVESFRITVPIGTPQWEVLELLGSIAPETVGETAPE